MQAARGFQARAIQDFANRRAFARAQAKATGSGTGAAGAIARLVALGATTPHDDADPRALLRTALHDVASHRVRHPGPLLPAHPRRTHQHRHRHDQRPLPQTNRPAHRSQLTDRSRPARSRAHQPRAASSVVERVSTPASGSGRARQPNRVLRGLPPRSCQSVPPALASTTPSPARPRAARVLDRDDPARPGVGQAKQRLPHTPARVDGPRPTARRSSTSARGAHVTTALSHTTATNPAGTTIGPSSTQKRWHTWRRPRFPALSRASGTNLSVARWIGFLARQPSTPACGRTSRKSH